MMVCACDPKILMDRNAIRVKILRIVRLKRTTNLTELAFQESKNTRFLGKT
jgi:hypothetical protein